ncbi:hypothetical protein [Rhodoferax sp.]|uniref:hypothetical protein n=1 Tax=Rhodoferax sp. TaxID=50421 RepID=UPI0027243BA1|nr:hypothetical protein [Rhodoferax sp.]MDO9196857.1 hypothetical protein [Rhodoferax sp.]
MNNSWLSMADEHLNAAFADLFPGQGKARVVVSHSWLKLRAGVLRRLDAGRDLSCFADLNNRGGTLGILGRSFATAAQAMDVPAASWLSDPELADVGGDEVTHSCCAECQRPIDWKVERYNE